MIIVSNYRFIIFNEINKYCMQEMNHLPSKEDLIGAINNSLTTKTNNILLTQASYLVGYSTSLFQIADNQKILHQIRHRALILAKDKIKYYWQSINSGIDACEKEAIKNSILDRIISCIQDDKLTKIYKEIITSIYNYQYQNWTITTKIIQKIQDQINLAPFFHVYLAIAKSFQLNIKKQDRHFFQHILLMVLPIFLSLINQHKKPQITYFGVKFLEKATRNQYQILPKLIKLSTKEQKFALDDPTIFLLQEDGQIKQKIDIKLFAVNIWINFSQLQRVHEHSINPLQIIQRNMNFFQFKLGGDDKIQKEIAMYLLCRVKNLIEKFKLNKQIIPSLISKYVVPQLQSQFIFLRLRAFEVLANYGSIQLQEQIVIQGAKCIITCLIKDQDALIRIKALFALTSILQHQITKQICLPFLQQIIRSCIHLLEKHNIQRIIQCIQFIVDVFECQISPFAFQIVQRLSTKYYKLYQHRKKRVRGKQGQQIEKLVHGYLRIIIFLIQSPLPEQIIQKIEGQVVQIVQFIFQLCEEYIEDCLLLLNAYIFKISYFSKKTQFLFYALISKLIKPDVQIFLSFKKIPLQINQQNILASRLGDESEELKQKFIYVIRIYIKKTAQKESSKYFKSNLICLLFELIRQTYKQQLRRNNRSQANINVYNALNCTYLMICLLQNFQKDLPQNLYNHMWQFSKINFISLKSNIFEILQIKNSQLIALLLWAAPNEIICMAQRQNLFCQIINEMNKYKDQYKHKNQCRRLILGINSLLLLTNKPAQLIIQFQIIFKTIIELVIKNANEQLQSFQDSQQSSIHGNNLWEEQFQSAMDQIDQVAEFKNTLQRLTMQQNHLYQRLIHSIQPDKIDFLKQLIKRAIQKKNQII